MKRITHLGYVSTSPWLLAAAAGLLIMIVVTFAFHNFRLEKRLMTQAMAQKAATLLRVLHTGSRASFFNDLRKDYWNNESWIVHVQRMIDHLAEDPDLRYLCLVDAQGKVIAHSEQAKIGTKQPRVSMKGEEIDDGKWPKMVFGIHDTREFGRVFEAIRPFTPLVANLFPLPLLPRNKDQGHLFRHREKSLPLLRLLPKGRQGAVQYYLLVGLDMDEFDQTLGRLRLQIVMLSLAMLLVGLGGWFSLSAVQGYRITKKTLKDMQAYTSLLIAKLPVGVIATGGSGRITTWNQAAADLTGIACEHALSKRPADILPQELAGYFSHRGHLTPENDGKAGFEAGLKVQFGNRKCDVRCHWLNIVDSERQFRGMVLLLSDVTELKSLEQRMRESERLAAVGRMAGGVAHEVRNPLSSVKGLALLLKQKFPLGSKEQETAELLIQETERMNRTITEMLSFTRPSTLRLDAVDLAALVKRCLQLIKIEAQENQVTIAFQVEPQTPAIYADRDRVQQVVMNVLLNALQAMEQGGQLSLFLGPGKSGMVELRVHDTGAGIPLEVQAQVFYPYFTTKQKGTGIGLAISQKIIVDHGGAIDLESEPGTGTTVIVQLPVAKKGVLSQPQEDGEADASC